MVQDYVKLHIFLIEKVKTFWGWTSEPSQICALKSSTNQGKTLTSWPGKMRLVAVAVCNHGYPVSIITNLKSYISSLG